MRETEEGCIGGGVTPSLPPGEEHATSAKIDAVRKDRLKRSMLRKGITLCSFRFNRDGGADWFAEAGEHLNRIAALGIRIYLDGSGACVRCNEAVSGDREVDDIDGAK